MLSLKNNQEIIPNISKEWFNAAKDEDSSINQLYNIYKRKIIESTDIDGQTALMKAAYHLQLTNVILLINLGESPFTKDNENRDTFDWVHKDYKLKDERVVVLVVKHILKTREISLMKMMNTLLNHMKSMLEPKEKPQEGPGCTIQ